MLDIDLYEWEMNEPSNYSEEEIEGALDLIGIVEIYRCGQNLDKVKSNIKDDSVEAKGIGELVKGEMYGQAMLLLCEIAKNKNPASQLIALAQKFEKKDPKFALDLYFFSAFFDPDKPSAYLSAANCLVARGKGKQALESLNFATDLIGKRKGREEFQEKIDQISKKICDKFSLACDKATQS